MKDKQLTGVYFRVEILKAGHYSFQIDNTPRRTFVQFGIDKVRATPYKYPEITF